MGQGNQVRKKYTEKTFPHQFYSYNTIGNQFTIQCNADFREENKVKLTVHNSLLVGQAHL